MLNAVPLLAVRFEAVPIGVIKNSLHPTITKQMTTKLSLFGIWCAAHHLRGFLVDHEFLFAPAPASLLCTNRHDEGEKCTTVLKIL